MLEILRAILKVSQYYVQEWILNQDQDANLKDLSKSKGRLRSSLHNGEVSEIPLCEFSPREF